MTIKRKACIAGAYEHPTRKAPDKTVAQLHAECARGALAGEARGRGTVWFVRQAACEWVLRHYRRGGWLGPWLGDRYLWLGPGRTRAAREWRLLAVLYGRGLPVPRPVAARILVGLRL